MSLPYMVRIGDMYIPSAYPKATDIGIARHWINTFKKPEIESILFMQRTVELAVGMKVMTILNISTGGRCHALFWIQLEEKEI